MSEDRYLTFALGKGRLANKTLDLLEQIGITCEEMKDKNTRKLIFVNEELKLKFFLSKALDVPTYVEYGAADIGVVGKDTILEAGKKVHEVLDLGFGKCRMCVCGPADAKKYLENHYLPLYEKMVMNGTLFQKMRKIDEIADQMREQMLTKMAKEMGVTEELKRTNQLEWVRKMEACNHQVEEIILKELVYS